MHNDMTDVEFKTKRFMEIRSDFLNALVAYFEETRDLQGDKFNIEKTIKHVQYYMHVLPAVLEDRLAKKMGLRMEDDEEEA
jgi:hypothetical protein